MRLFQLARKLEITPQAIVTLLAEHGIDVENKSNIRLGEDQIRIVTDHYKGLDVFAEEAEEETADEDAHLQEEMSLENDKPDQLPEMSKSEEEKEEKAEPETAQPEEPVGRDKEPEELEEKQEEEIEVIRVKKIKLAGPKVVGKIDLPEPVKKEKKESEEEESTRRQSRERYHQRGRSGYGRKKRETLEQKRQREARKKARQKKELEKVKKEKRKKFYVENVQPLGEAQAKKKKHKKQIQQTTPSSRHPKVRHSNPLKRLWSWLNGEYDRY